MTTLKIDDRMIELPKYKLSMMIEAAPAIDRVLKVATAFGTSDDDAHSIASMFEVTSDIIEVIAVGTSSVDPLLTAEHLRDVLGLGDMSMLQAAFSGVLADAGVFAVTQLSSHNDATGPDTSKSGDTAA